MSSGWPVRPSGDDDSCGYGAFGFDDSRVNGVDADLFRSEFAGEYAGDGIDCAFGGGVDRAVGRRKAGDAGADVDDAGAFAEVLDGCLRGEQNAEDIGVEQSVERFE